MLLMMLLPTREDVCIILTMCTMENDCDHDDAIREEQLQ